LHPNAGAVGFWASHSWSGAAIVSALTPPKILADRSGSDEAQLPLEARHALCDFSFVFLVSLAAISLPIGFETAPLVEMDENAANLKGRKFTIKTLCRKA
jgi:hypothetical protein